MKIKNAYKVLRESENAPLNISGLEGKGRSRVAMFREKDNENNRHGVYKTNGGLYYNRYYVKDMYGAGDELGNKGTTGPFATEEDAIEDLKKYKGELVRESYKRRFVKEDKGIISQVRRDIEMAKRRLANSDFGENFGQKEVRKIKDKYFDYIYEEPGVAKAIDAFDEWCSTYVPKRIRESKKLNENAPNFSTFSNFPLLIFYDVEDVYEDSYDRVVDWVRDDLGDKANGLEDWEISELPEFEEVWNKYFNYCVLERYEIKQLEQELEDFNKKMRNDDRYDEYEDVEVELSVEPGYYEAAQIYIADEKYLSDWQIEEINKFLKEIKKKYRLTELGLSYQFSNGEAGYHKIDESRKIRNRKLESRDRRCVNGVCKDTRRKTSPNVTYRKNLRDPERDAQIFNTMMGSERLGEGCRHSRRRPVKRGRR